MMEGSVYNVVYLLYKSVQFVAIQYWPVGMSEMRIKIR